MLLRPLRVFVLDDEPLAVKRLVRLLKEIDGVTMAGSATNPLTAIGEIDGANVDVLLLDIEMPGLTGFELIDRLETSPAIVFTTAYDQYALQAFEKSTVDYVVKPIARDRLERALQKASRFDSGTHRAESTDVQRALEDIATALKSRPAYPDRIASTIAGRTQLVDLSRITHFYASDKLTYAATTTRPVPIDATLNELETRMDPGRFIRIHRAALVNIAFVAEVKSNTTGMVVKLMDAGQTEIPVARERLRVVKARLGM
jgi:two-component system LytT family response regulator